MKSLPLLKQATKPAPSPLTPAEFHARILALVEQLGEATDVGVWQASKPDYFPWQPFFQALKTLHAQGQLQFVMLAPGHWVARSLTFVAQQPPPQPRKSPPKPRPVPVSPPPKKPPTKRQPPAKPIPE